MKTKEEITEKASEYVDSVRNRIDSYAYLDVQEAFAEGAKWMQEQVNGVQASEATAILPHVRCFKTYGEKIIKELGFELEHKYDHDQFHTNRYRKGLLMVEFTYEGFTLKTVDLTIDETFCKPITYLPHS